MSYQTVRDRCNGRVKNPYALDGYNYIFEDAATYRPKKGEDSMLGGGPYEATRCPECGSIMWNGRCENTDCVYNRHPLDAKEGEEE